MIKNIIYIEDGSIDVEELEQCLDETTKIIVYRQGSKPPQLVQPQSSINCTCDSELTKLNDIINAADAEVSQILKKLTSCSVWLYKGLKNIQNILKQRDTE